MAVLFMFFLVIVSIIFACCTGLFSKDDSPSENNLDARIIRTIQKEQELYEKQEYERWVKIATPILDEFRNTFKLITSDHALCDASVTEIENLCTRCESLWYAYHHSQEGIQTWVHSKDFMRQYLGSDYEQSMYCSDHLRKRINSAKNLAILGRNKGKICEDIFDLISSQGRVMRCKIKKMDTFGATPEQIEACCEYLVSKGRIVKYKDSNNNRYYYAIK